MKEGIEKVARELFFGCAIWIGFPIAIGLLLLIGMMIIGFVAALFG